MKKLIFIILISIVFFFILILLTRGSIKPWKKNQFLSIEKEDYKLISSIDNYSYLISKYHQAYINNVFVYVTSHGTDETMYSEKNPYKLTVHFCTLEDDKQVSISNIKVTGDNIYYYDDINFSESIVKRNVVNGSTFEKSLSKDALLTYSTPYVIDIADNKEKIIIELAGKINNENMNLTFELKRYESKGLIRWGF